MNNHDMHDDCGEWAVANERLRGAAPDLLEALQDMFAMIGESLLRDTFGSDWVHKASAAIAKATGGEA